MKCPRCQMEIDGDARFCTACGCSIAAAAKREEPPAPVPQATCAKCGAALLEGARFCTKCGTMNAPSAVQEDADSTVILYDYDDQEDGGISSGDISRGGLEWQDYPWDRPIPPEPISEDTPGENDDAENKKKNKKHKKEAGGKPGLGWIIVIVLLALLMAASVVVCFLVWNGTIPLP